MFKSKPKVTYALRVAFPGLEPMDVPLTEEQGKQFTGLLARAVEDSALDAMIRGQLDAAILAKMQEMHPDAGHTLDQVRAARPGLSVVASPS